MSRLSESLQMFSANPKVIHQIACVANHAQPLFSSSPSVMMVGEQAKFSIVQLWIISLEPGSFDLEACGLSDM